MGVEVRCIGRGLIDSLHVPPSEDDAWRTCVNKSTDPPAPASRDDAFRTDYVGTVIVFIRSPNARFGRDVKDDVAIPRRRYDCVAIRNVAANQNGAELFQF